jgi:hypothetical protein
LYGLRFGGYRDLVALMGSHTIGHAHGRLVGKTCQYAISGNTENARFMGKATGDEDAKGGFVLCTSINDHAFFTHFLPIFCSPRHNFYFSLVFVGVGVHNACERLGVQCPFTRIRRRGRSTTSTGRASPEAGLYTSSSVVHP